MAIRNNPGTVSSNVVFAYDIADVKNSYIGQPTTNQYANPDFTSGLASWQFASWDGGIYSYTTENVLGPFGNVVPALKITRTSSSSGAADFHQGNGGKYTSGNSYTLSAYVKGSGTLVGATQGGFSGGGVGFTLTDQWQRVSYTVASSTNSNYPYWAAASITPNVPMYFVFAQSEQKSNVTPYVNGTRSNTQGLLDISGYANSINLANVSFNASANPTFDGTDDSMVVANSNSFKSGLITVETIIKFNSFKSADLVQFGVGSGAYAQWYFRDLGNGNFNWFQWATGGNTYSDTVVSRSSLVTGKYYHIVCTATNATSTAVYYNGSLAGSAGSTVYSTPSSWTPADLTIGGFSWDGYSNTDIPIVRVYNKVLSSSEILQNYNSFKTRFNL